MIKILKKLLGRNDQLDIEPLRVAKVAIDARTLVSIFKYLQDGVLVSLEGLPADAKAVGISMDQYYPDRVQLFIESEAFKLVHPGYEIPYMDPLIMHVKYDSDKD